MGINAMFQKRKETKNKVRFEEITGDGTPERIGTLYVHKDAFKELGSPSTVNLTLEAAE